MRDIAVHEGKVLLLSQWPPPRDEHPRFHDGVPGIDTVVNARVEGVRRLVNGPRGRLWVLSQGSHVGLMSGSVGPGQVLWHSPPTGSPFGWGPTAMGDPVTAQGSLWMPTHEGVLRLTGRRWTLYQSNNKPVWSATAVVHTDPYEYYRRSRRRLWREVQRFSGLYKNPNVHQDREMAVDDAGRVWCGDHYFSAFENKWRPAKGDLKRERWRSVVLRDGRLFRIPDEWWEATDSKDEFNWSAWCDNRLAGREHTFALGPDGRLWIGSKGGGVAVFDGKTWVVFNAEDGLPGNDVTGLAFEDRTAWLTTGLGVGRIDF